MRARGGLVGVWCGGEVGGGKCLCDVYAVDAEVCVGVREDGVVDLLDGDGAERVFAVALVVAKRVSGAVEVVLWRRRGVRCC